MSDWLYRIMMAVLAIMLVSQIVFIAMTPTPVVGCVNGYVMEQHKDMWVQKGLFVQHCVAIDRD